MLAAARDTNSSFQAVKEDKNRNARVMAVKPSFRRVEMDRAFTVFPTIWSRLIY